MQYQKLRESASDFLKKHGHPKYAQMIKRRCVFYVIEALLKRHGKKELLRLYRHMSKDLKRGLLFWIPIGPSTMRLEDKLLAADNKYRYIRDGLQFNREDLPKDKVEAYFKNLEDVVLPWLKGDKNA